MESESIDPGTSLVIHEPVIEAARGLGDLFGSSHFEITEEEFDDRVQESIYGSADHAWSDLTSQMIRSSCIFFAQEVLTGSTKPPYNGRFLVGDHHEEWDELVANHDRICVLCSRDHGKTYFFDFAYPIWRAFHNRKGCGFIFSATQAQASKILGEIIEEIESNPELQWLVPDKKVMWGNTQIMTSNGHRIYARGFGTKVRGAHPDWIIVDDGLNDETIYSEMVRKKQIEYFKTAITNMVVPGGQIIVIGTPLHAEDLYAELQKNTEYEFRRYESSPEKPLWPERYSSERLAKRKIEIGPICFTREFLCQPISDEMSLFPLRLFRGDPTEQFSVKLGMPLKYWQEAGVDIFMGGDFAMSANVGADYTVVFTMGVDGFGNRWIINIERVKGMPYQEQLSMINTTGRKYDPSLIFLEGNQMQRIFGDELIRTTDLPIKQFVTGVEKHCLEKGVPSLRVLLENGKFRIPRGDAHSVEMTDIWINEMRSTTWQDGKIQSVGGHDDTVMACIGPGAIVTTMRGKKPIEDIHEGEYVLTHLGNWGKVTATMSREYLGSAYMARASGCNPFMITSEHPIWSAQVKRPRGRYVPDNWKFRHAERIQSGPRLEGHYGYLPTPTWPEYSLEFDLADFVKFQELPKSGARWKKDGRFIWWRRDRRVPRKLVVDEDFAFLIGLYLAEGWSSQNHVGLGLHIKETYIRDFVLRESKRNFTALGGFYPDRSSGFDINKSQGMTVWFSSVPATNWFMQMESKRGKGMPHEWMGWPLTIRMQIVRGWLVGDGSRDRQTKRRGGDGLGGVTISARLRDQILWTLREAGFVPAFCRFSNENEAWKITLNASDARKLLETMNSVEAIRWKNVKLTSRQAPTNCRSLSRDGGVAARFTRMQEVEYEGPVFNLQIEGDESYVVEDVAVHNCYFCDQAIRQGGFGFSLGDEEEYAADSMEDIMKELTGEDPKKDGNPVGLDGMPKY